MSTPPGSMELSGLRGWRVSFVLFLAFLTPVTPLLAEIQSNPSARDAVLQTALCGPPGSQLRHVPSQFVALDLFGGENLLNPATAWFLPAGTFSACDAGRAAADRETDGTLWFVMSTLISFWGVLLAYVITPSVPESNLKGKNSTYVAAYTPCYQDKAQAIHVKWAWYGTLASAVLWCIVVVVLMATNKGVMNN